MSFTDNLESYKIVIVGNAAVGKSSLVNQFAFGRKLAHPSTTIGAAFCTKYVVIGDRHVRINIWDTAGQEKYRSIVNIYYRGTNACLIVFDVNNRKSFDDVEWWIDQYTSSSRLSPKKIILVANKSDIDQSYWCVTPSEISIVAERNGCDCFYTSCMSGEGVDAVLDSIVAYINELSMMITDVNPSTLSTVIELRRVENNDCCF
jgi:small GTP-binding protein